MYLVKVVYKETVHHRVSTCGGMDSEYSHSSVETREALIVVPDRSTKEAEDYIRYSGGRSSDANFAIIHTTLMAPITAIIRPPLTRL